MRRIRQLGLNLTPPIRRFVLRLSLRLQKTRAWHDKLKTSSRIFGAPINEEKLWNAFKGKMATIPSVCLAPFTYWYRRNLWVEARTIGVRIRVQTIKPIKPGKKFIITLVNLPQSMEAAEHCIESAKLHGEHHGLEITPATSKFEAEDFFIRHGFTWFHTDYNFRKGKDPLPEMGCFASHYRLWQRCVELDEPIIILEHDAVFRSSIPPLRFKHVILLSRPSFTNGRYRFRDLRHPRPREIFYPMNMLAAAHCYAISPSGARILINAAERELIFPADSFINKARMDILYYHPYLVDFSYDFSTIDARHPNSLLPERIWESYEKNSR